MEPTRAWVADPSTAGPSIRRRRRFRSLLAATVAACTVASGALAAGPAAAQDAGSSGSPMLADPFYTYSGPTPLGEIAPGTVLKTRPSVMHLATLPTPIQATQVLYRSNDSMDRPVATATTILQPFAPGPRKILSYQSAYDALSPQCEPSAVLAGGGDPGLITSGESILMAGFLTQGYTVVMSDFEGQHPQFAAGATYGKATLDGIRAASREPSTGLTEQTPVAMLGYSGGAIATEWASELAPTYAPDVSSRLVGSAMGGLLINPLRNLTYINGSPLWSGVAVMALIGYSRAFGIDLSPYLSPRGEQVVSQMQNACITGVLGRFPGLTFAEMVKPEYADPQSIPPLRELAPRVDMGHTGTPTSPLLVRQALAGWMEGGDGNKPGIGPGDGVMILGDTRVWARNLCRAGVPIDYGEYPLVSHTPGALQFFWDSVPWLQQRFDHVPAPSTCGVLEPGAPLAPWY